MKRNQAFRIERLHRLPANFDAVADTLASRLERIYGKAGAELYRQHAPAAFAQYTEQPAMRFWAALAGDSCLALVLTQMPGERGEISMVHVESDRLPAAVENKLVLKAIDDLKERGASAILAEFFPTSRIRSRGVFGAAGFRRFEREMMTAPLHPDAPVVTQAACREMRREEAEAAGQCLAAAYAGDPGSHLHEEMRTATEAAYVARKCMEGGFGATAPGMCAAVWEGGRCAAVALGCLLAPHVGFTLQLATHPECRGYGYARQAMLRQHDAFRQAGCTETTLAVTQANAPARTLYHGLGYQRVCTFDAWVWYRQPRAD